MVRHLTFENENETDLILVQQVKDFFGSDRFYMRLISRVSSNNWKNTTHMELPFFWAHKLLLVGNGLLYHQDRLYIPSTFQVVLLVQVHNTHMGVHQTLKNVLCWHGGQTWFEMCTAS